MKCTNNDGDERTGRGGRVKWDFVISYLITENVYIVLLFLPLADGYGCFHQKIKTFELILVVTNDTFYFNGGRRVLRIGLCGVIIAATIIIVVVIVHRRQHCRPCCVCRYWCYRFGVRFHHWSGD